MEPSLTSSLDLSLDADSPDETIIESSWEPPIDKRFRQILDEETPLLRNPRTFEHFRRTERCSNISIPIEESILEFPLVENGEFLTRFINQMWKRNLLFNVICPLVVVAWVSIPFPDAISSGQVSNPEPHKSFFFLLLIYLGFYNFIGLLLVTRIFQVFQLDWWPRNQNRLVWMFWTWLIPIAIGGLHHYILKLRNNMFYILITLATLLFPVISGWWKIRKTASTLNLNDIQSNIVFSEPKLQRYENKLPAAYKRFLWFTFILIMAIVALFISQSIAYYFVNMVLPNASNFDGILYTNGMMGFIYFFDGMVNYVIESKIDCEPLSYIFRLYFYELYFIYYRNLFARLRFSQFLVIQLCSSIWVTVIYPLQMSETAFWLQTKIFGTRKTHLEYKRNIGKTFFIRNIAENSTMIVFVAACTILHFGPNQLQYPFYAFKKPSTETIIINTVSDRLSSYSYATTMIYSLLAFLFEISTSFLTRRIFKSQFGMHITRDAVLVLKKNPGMILCMCLVIVHVLMDIFVELVDIASFNY